jgi:heptosyltransferase-2
VSGGCIVRLPTWLGDNVMALPALRALQRATPAPLLLWGPPAYRELHALAGLETDYLPYRRRPGPAGISDAIHAVAALRHRRAAIALLLPNAFEAALLAALAGVPRRIGYATDGRGRLLTDPVPPPGCREPRHEADRFARLAQRAGAGEPSPADALVPAGDQLRERAAGLPDGGDLLAVVAGSANAPAKRWPAAAYAELISEAGRRWGARPVLLGSDADRPINAEIGARATVATTDLSGCDLPGLAAALSRCRAVVGNDTGATHLAAALGRPTAVIIGPTDPRRTCPRGPQVLVLSAGCFCQPCGADRCPLDHRCMSRLAATELLARIEPLWQAGA